MRTPELVTEDGRLVLYRDDTEIATTRSGHTYKRGDQRARYECPVPVVEFDDTARHLAAVRNPNRHRITLALDLRALWGPEVDWALGHQEPTVDEWEEGVAIPTREDVGRLSFLTQLPPAFFYGDTPPQVQVLCPSAWAIEDDDEPDEDPVELDAYPEHLPRT